MPFTPPSPSTQTILRLRMPNGTWRDDDITNSSSATQWDAVTPESDMVLVLAVVAAVGIILILCLLLAAVAICRLRKLTGTEPQLLTFSQSPAAKPRSSVTGFINKAYEETPSPPSCVGEPSTAGVCETSDTESSIAADAAEDLQPTRRTAPKVPPRRHLPDVGVGHVTAASCVTTSPVHGENGISECVNPLYTKDKNNKPYVSLPLEAITEGDDDDDVDNNGEGHENSSRSPKVVQSKELEVAEQGPKVPDLDQSCVISTTFHDVDDTMIGPAPGVNMAEAVSATQSCPNSPLMSPGGSTDRTLPPGGTKVNWASDSRLPDDGGNDGYRPAFTEQRTDATRNQQNEPGAAPVPHWSWMGQLDTNWEAETTF